MQHSRGTAQSQKTAAVPAWGCRSWYSSSQTGFQTAVAGAAVPRCCSEPRDSCSTSLGVQKLVQQQPDSCSSLGSDPRLQRLPRCRRQTVHKRRILLIGSGQQVEAWVPSHSCTGSYVVKRWLFVQWNLYRCLEEAPVLLVQVIV